MNPLLSWARKDRTTDSALRHETYHFHLNEVYRRKLESALAAVRVCGKTVEETRSLLDRQVHEVADQILFQAESVQQSYELETEHGSDTGAQFSWEQRIDAWLDNPASAP
jgi:predicted secreted Zn-dependent protease